MEIKKKEPKYMRTSLNIQTKYVQAMDIIKDEKFIHKSAQVELGLRLYLKEHQKLLKQKGIDLWGAKK